MICDPYVNETDLVECSCNTGELSPTTINSLLFAASDWMYRKTGEQFGGFCEVTERPCGCGCGCGLLTTQWALTQGFGMLVSGSCCNGLCGCSAEAAIKLTYGPVQSATVTIEGVAFTDFTVVQPNLIVRTDGGQWPSCQSYLEGWTITYTYGVEPPELVKQATQDIAIELVKACPGGPGGDCALPAGTVSVNQRGVQISIDPAQVGNALPRVALALDVYGRIGQADVRIPGRRGLVTAGPSGS